MKATHTLIGCLILVSSTAYAKDYRDMSAEERRLDAKTSLPNRFAVQHTALTSDILQAVGQVVLRKAVRAGWHELESRLSDLAGCTENKLPNTCKTLGQARIEDLIASPRVLLDAFTTDLLSTLMRSSLHKIPGSIPVEAFATSWATIGSNAIALRATPWLKGTIAAHASDALCPTDKAGGVAWALGQCYVASQDLSSCNLDSILKACPFDDNDRADVERVGEIAIAAFKAIDDNSSSVTNLTIQLFFEWGMLLEPNLKDVLAALETTFTGLADKDWTRVVVGVGHLASGSHVDMKLVRIVGAIGQFAETYSTKPTDTAAAREKVIEDLVTGLVDRTDRDHGAVVSLGGALGVLGGVRFNSSGYEFALPVRLTIGVGIDTYHTSKCGFHASLDAFDLGEYVTYSSNALDVSPPDIKSAVVVGATLGFWFADRDTPLFIAVHAAASPFVRSTNDKLTYEAGLMFGVYIPLLDFN